MIDRITRLDAIALQLDQLCGERAGGPVRLAAILLRDGAAPEATVSIVRACDEIARDLQVLPDARPAAALWQEVADLLRAPPPPGPRPRRVTGRVTLPGGEVLLSALVEPWARRLQLLVVRLDGAPAALSRRERAALELTLYRRCAAAAAAELVELDAAEKLPS